MENTNKWFSPFIDGYFMEGTKHYVIVTGSPIYWTIMGLFDRASKVSSGPIAIIPTPRARTRRLRTRREHTWHRLLPRLGISMMSS